MPRWMRVAAVLFSSLGLLAASSCMAVSGPNGFAGTSPAGSYSYERNSSSGGSLFGGSSSTASGTPSTSGSYASSSASSSAGASSSGAVPPGYTNDSSQSTALTNYLQKNRLPLVGAQVMTNTSGNRQVILYGFVATDFGKQDAVGKARGYLGDPNVGVVNRIAVRPELLASGSGTPPPPSSTSSGTSSGSYSTGGLGSVQSYENQTQQAQSQQYMQNQSGLTALLPLIGMMGLLSMGNSSFGMGYGGYPPTYGSPYGPTFGSPYSPYPMAPYGSPYGGSPFGYGGYGGYGGGFTFP